MSRNKKGVVYRATMFMGLGIVLMQAGGEAAYSAFMKTGRNKEIEEEKK